MSNLNREIKYCTGSVGPGGNLGRFKSKWKYFLFLINKIYFYGTNGPLKDTVFLIHFAVQSKLGLKISDQKRDICHTVGGAGVRKLPIKCRVLFEWPVVAFVFSDQALWMWSNIGLWGNRCISRPNDCDERINSLCIVEDLCCARSDIYNSFFCLKIWLKECNNISIVCFLFKMFNYHVKKILIRFMNLEYSSTFSKSWFVLFNPFSLF